MFGSHFPEANLDFCGSDALKEGEPGDSGKEMREAGKGQKPGKAVSPAE